jgi:deoxyribodipyrimidine photolyase-related protein
MSDYCNKCHYKVSQKNGPDACPFNYLYWDFLSRNQDKLKKNNRLGFVYKNLERMDEEKIETIKKDSRRFLKSLENGEEV